MNARLLAVMALFASLALPCAAETPSPSGRTMADVLARLETFATVAMAEEKVPGMAYAVVKDGAVIFAKGYGKRKLGDAADNVTTETLFEIGSTTKAFTAALVAMEVDAGKISWDDRVVTHVPDFRMDDPWVTAEFRVCDLLSQRSGMPEGSLDAMAVLGYTRADIERAIAHVEPTFSFRNGFGYVNTLWLTAARLVEKLEGTSWEEAVSRRILQPLGMRESTVDPEMARLVPDRAAGHYLDNLSVTPIPEDWPYRTWLDTFGPAGSIRSTILDFAQWAAFHLAHGRVGTTALLNPATVDAMHAPRTYIAQAIPGLGGSATATSYALGWLHEELPAGTIVWHNGGTTGQHAFIGLFEHANVALVVLTNLAGNSVPERMRLELLDLLFIPPGSTPTRGEATALDRPARPAAALAPLAPIPPLPLERYAGTYENPAYGPFTVQLKDGALVMAMGPRAVEGRLTPWSGDTFLLHVLFTLPPADVPVTFTVPEGHPASRFVAPVFHEARGGVFQRTQ